MIRRVITTNFGKYVELVGISSSLSPAYFGLVFADDAYVYASMSPDVFSVYRETGFIFAIYLELQQ